MPLALEAVLTTGPPVRYCFTFKKKTDISTQTKTQGPLGVVVKEVQGHCQAHVFCVERGAGLGTGQGVRKPREVKIPNAVLAPAQVHSGKGREASTLWTWGGGPHLGVHTGGCSTALIARGHRPQMTAE